MSAALCILRAVLDYCATGLASDISKQEGAPESEWAQVTTPDDMLLARVLTAEGASQDTLKEAIAASEETERHIEQVPDSESRKLKVAVAAS